MIDLRTPRLLLRPWHQDDAARLHPILAANQSHLGDWVPRRISRVVPVPELADRLREFADAFASNREWRYAVISAADGDILGEADLFSRDATGRVAYEDADRAEIGYWLREDATGRGYATEAARSLVEYARTLKRFKQVEIRCDARNVASAALPKRLGFTRTNPETAGLQVWSLDLCMVELA